MSRKIKIWGKTPKGTHVPIMVREVMKYLAPAVGETVVDCTVGYGGHASEFARWVGDSGKVLGFDVDGSELARTYRRFVSLGIKNVSLHHSSYEHIREFLAGENIEKADVIFADLGVSSMQVDDPQRGMSYKHQNAPLDMRMDTRIEKTAGDVLAEISQEDLSAALRDYSDEPDHEKIAEWIINQRQVTPFVHTSQLIGLVMAAKGLTKKTWKDDETTRFGELHPAARTFQTLRIIVNDELGRIERFLRVASDVLGHGGRIGILSFHSGEDRLIKNHFRDGFKSGLYSKTSIKPLVPMAKEVRANPRSASAKFRWAVKD